LGVETGVKLGLWGGSLILGLALFMIAWGYFIGSDAITLSLFLIILLAAVFSIIIIFKPQKRLSTKP
jgi:hypothetical protein